MPESATPPAARPAPVVARVDGRVLPAALGAGVLLALLGGFGGVLAALSGLLAQPAFAVAARLWRARHPDSGRLEAPRRFDARRDGLALLLMWGGAGLALALLLAWPLSALVARGSLSAALGVSIVCGAALVGLWRLWPMWQSVERRGGPLPPAWHALADVEVGAWRGLVVASVVLGLLGLAVLMAWPGLLAPAARWSLAVLVALGSPLLHAWLQGIDEADPVLVVGGEEAAEGEAHEAPVVASPGEPLEPALYAAARGGRVERALELIADGADPHAPPPEGDRDRRSLAALAAVLPDLRLLRQLIAEGVDLNATAGGMTPLVAATRDSWHGRPDAVMTLLANGADPRLADADGNTPLHHAARSSDPGVAALLRDAAAELDVLNADAQSPLCVACASGNWRLARFLLERGAQPHPPGGQPALLAAAGGEDDDVAGVQLLLKQKARVDAQDPRGRTALHEAVWAGHGDIIATLLAADADPALVDGQGRNAVLEACRAGRAEVLEQLLVHLPRDGAQEAGVVDARGHTAVHLACMAEGTPPAMVQRLLALGVDPEQRDGDGKRALDRAAESGRWALVAALDAGYDLPSRLVEDEGDAGFDADAVAPIPDRAPAELLRDALREGRENGAAAIARLLPAAELGRILRGNDPQPTAAQAAWLCRQGADTGLRDADGDTVLFAWLAEGASARARIQALLGQAVSPAGAGGLARYLAACARQGATGAEHEMLALDLLARGADPFGASREGDVSSTLAVRLGWARLLRQLCELGVDLNRRDSHGMSPLHLAAALGRTPMLRLLVAHGAAPDLLAADGQTPLGVALSSGRRDLADWLDWRGWSLPRRPLRDSDVPAAAIVGDADAVRRLLDLGLPVDAVDNQGCTALLRAAGGGHGALIDLLLVRGADPQCAANSGATPLSAAVSMRHTDIVDRLIEAGASLEQRLPGDLTVLMVACALGLPDMAARLLAAGADAHALDSQGRMAIHCAAMYGFTARERSRLIALFDTLLLTGGDADSNVEAAGTPPLLLLLGARAEPGTVADEDSLVAGLELLLDHEARLDVADPRGFGPLHLAALHGLLEVVRWLLRAGADPDARDSLNRTPREIAVMRGFVDIAAEFAPPTANPNVSMARFLRDKS
ncbi:ankyrin repeat domain-containing protein [Marilutibacter spongiae]|uniref:Ankyrin repeat domain-containing protein n=1 Tax=Marilutibacter spongiae TaxID=2025720 RepID=A0A7W3TK93_9GAMM|nr:ankyrin repeat domain-containing protein [Lysobacter spongiae]MBB1059861.1 ankyrin repeat domain-containing protein [Lysobacter spongiae]